MLCTGKKQSILTLDDKLIINAVSIKYYNGKKKYTSKKSKSQNTNISCAFLATVLFV